ncbi:hypothetical protein [Actinoplanes utahensis]|uniref:Uncharacterized protein n=1 Tax=Actinoplanes utahensis TaxID=1869 RepID=A0A0A6UCN2_ACTUT|nr:hypothetical protein [Actinoplanes utahensis]KHD73246.1 hypothetical protein MB27_35405 [Actinoplanes utahensis]
MRSGDGRHTGNGRFARNGKFLGMVLSAGLLAGVLATMRLGAEDGHTAAKIYVSTVGDGAASGEETIIRGVSATVDDVATGRDFNFLISVTYACTSQPEIRLGLRVDPAAAVAPGAGETGSGEYTTDLACTGHDEWSTTFPVKISRDVGWSGGGTFAFEIMADDPSAPVSLEVEFRDADLTTRGGSPPSAPAASAARWDRTGSLSAEGRFVEKGLALRAAILEGAVLLALLAQVAVAVSHLVTRRREGSAEPSVEAVPVGAEPPANVGYGEPRYAGELRSDDAPGEDGGPGKAESAVRAYVRSDE